MSKNKNARQLGQDCFSGSKEYGKIAGDGLAKGTAATAGGLAGFFWGLMVGVKDSFAADPEEEVTEA
jgi:hypothetical protein